jgi:hypothetical protein
MNRDTTVIYYSSCRENQEFEDKIRQRLLKTIGDMPLISVTQKPLPNFGYNICVGDVGTSTHNVHRQLQLGCLKATTKYVCTAEADCIYPPTGYFDFRPPKEYENDPRAYHYISLWILYKNKQFFQKKAWSLSGLFSNREFLLYRLNRALSWSSEWVRDQDHASGPNKFKYLFWRQQGWDTIQYDEMPIVNIKTGDGMYKHTGTYGDRVKEIPYWGKISDLSKDLWPKK